MVNFRDDLGHSDSETNSTANKDHSHHNNNDNCLGCKKSLLMQSVGNQRKQLLLQSTDELAVGRKG